MSPGQEALDAPDNTTTNGRSTGLEWWRAAKVRQHPDGSDLQFCTTRKEADGEYCTTAL